MTSILRGNYHCTIDLLFIWFALLVISVTRLGNLLGKFSKPVAIILGNFCKVVEIFHFASEFNFWATFIDIWRLFTCHTACDERLVKSKPLKRELSRTVILPTAVTVL